METPDLYITPPEPSRDEPFAICEACGSDIIEDDTITILGRPYCCNARCAGDAAIKILQAYEYTACWDNAESEAAAFALNQVLDMRAFRRKRAAK